MNVDHAVTKDWEAKSFTEICKAPIEALEGIGNQAGRLWESLGVKTTGDLAMFQHCKMAEAICNAARHMNTLEQHENFQAHQQLDQDDAGEADQEEQGADVEDGNLGLLRPNDPVENVLWYHHLRQYRSLCSIP